MQRRQFLRKNRFQHRCRPFFERPVRLAHIARHRQKRTVCREQFRRNRRPLPCVRIRDHRRRKQHRLPQKRQQHVLQHGIHADNRLPRCRVIVPVHNKPFLQIQQPLVYRRKRLLLAKKCRHFFLRRVLNKPHRAHQPHVVLAQQRHERPPVLLLAQKRPQLLNQLGLVVRRAHLPQIHPHQLKKIRVRQRRHAFPPIDDTLNVQVVLLHRSSPTGEIRATPSPATASKSSAVL